MKKNLLLVAAFFVGIASYAQCEAVAELDENFNSFTFTGPGTGLPQNCWSNIATGPLVYISGADGDNYATFYASNSANVDAYLISPELSTLGGNYELSFDTSRIVMGPPPAPGTVTIQLGTLSSNTDASTFVAFGDPIAVTDATVTHANIAITAAAGQKYIAFKIVGNTIHNAALIDNVKWSEIPVTCSAVATLNENFNSFTFTGPGTGLPQSCWSNIATGPLVYISGADGDNYATFYASNSANVDAYLVTPELTTLGGNYELSFDTSRIVMGPPPAPGTVTIQLGTLSSNTDASTFVAFGDPIAVTDATVTHANIAITAAAGQKYIAFKIVGNTVHNAALIDNVVWSEIPVTCPAVATLDENFNSFTFTAPGTGLPQNCWSNIATGPLVYISGDEGDNYATFYASNSANVDAYLVTPELTTLGGNYELSFDTSRIVMGPPPAPGTVTIQLGTLSSNTDASTFVSFGDPIAVTDANVIHANIAITAAAGQKYIAFKIVGNTVHNAALIDNVKWSEIIAGTNDLNKTSFSIYPNPSADKNITINHNLDTKGSVNIYSLTGAAVFSGELDNTGTQSLNLSSLSAGMYIVKIESGSYSESKKLIIQ